ncbi:MAG: type II secretion system protein [Desulfobacterales bacterium]|jgi:prepilin-type N-terminal cleavage/methylation domain-containing protein
MKRDQHGFTLVEITAVLVLMAIISAYVIGRSIGTEQIDLAGQTDKIRTQIRYAQALAMKRSDAIWGITCNTNQYWMFRTNTGTPELLPGEQNAQITLSDLGVGMSAFTLFFDRIGKPYIAYTDEDNNTPLDSYLIITISAGGSSRTIRVIPETGLAR